MASDQPDPCKAQPRLRLALASGCFLVTAVVAGTTWYSTIDSISYLDIARFVSERNWSVAVNPFWGLFYAWTLGLFFTLTGTQPIQEVLAIRLVNILMLLLTVAAFDFLLGGLLAGMRYWTRQGRPLLQERAICVSGYGLLLWSCFCLNWPARISPDMLVSAIFFVAAGLLLRIGQQRHLLLNSVLFGLTLVAGYYTKAVYVPLGLVLLGCFGVLLFRVRRLWPALPLALLVLVVGCAPYYRAVSRHTRGVPNAASLNYAWHVNNLWYFAHWHGEGENVGAPLHPTQQITQGLRAYSFVEPIHATYAPWYDPSYWYAGFRTGFIPANQVRTLRETVPATIRELGSKPVVWAAALCLLVLLLGNQASFRKSSCAFLDSWPVVLPALAGCAIYLAVHMEIRYIQPMVCCLMLVFLAALRVEERPGAHRFPALTPAFASQVTAGILLAASISSVTARVRHVVDYVSVVNPLQHNREWILAEYLNARHAGAGHKAAVIGDGIDCMWAFLDNVRVVAELPRAYDLAIHKGDADAFWSASPVKQQELLAAFKHAGADFVIADPKVKTSPGPEWLPVEDTGYYYHALASASQGIVNGAAGP